MNKLNPLIVMYHYVRDDSAKNSFSTQRFRNQVKDLVARYKVATLTDFLAGEGDHDPEKTCILTFDDGLLDAYLHAAPILEEYDVRGVFFVPTCIFTDQTIIPAQKRSLLLAKIGLDPFLQEYNSVMPAHYRIMEGKVMDQYNSPLASILKHLLDHMELEISTPFLDRLFAKHFDEQAEFKRMYLTENQVRELKKRGHDIGGHGHAHRWLGNLYPSDQHQDLVRGVAVFKEKFGHHPRFMSYPFGSRNEITLRLLPTLGFEAAMLDPSSAVANPNLFELNRFDCIDVEAGKISNHLSRVTER